MAETTFRLTACREVLEAHPDAPQYAYLIPAIERAAESDATYTALACRSLVETVCKTVCRERGRSAPKGMGPLLKRTIDILPMRLADEPEADTDLRRGLRQIRGGLNQLVQGISTIRMTFGTGAHGPDAYASLLDERYGELIARATDAAVALIFRLHLDNPIDDGDEDEPNERFDPSAPFNRWIDDQHEPFAVLDSVLAASEVLFRTDRTAYDAHLAEFVPEEVVPGGEEK